MFRVRPAALAILLAFAGGIGLSACDQEPQRGERKAEDRGERTIGEKPPPDAEPGRAGKAEPGSPERAQVPKPPSAGPETPAGAVATVVGTWRLRLESGADEAQPGVTYTFTADGRVTVGPDQTCRYKVENQVLSIDCAGTTAESASGRIEREDQNNLVWKVGDKTVRLERQSGLKEQQ